MSSSDGTLLRLTLQAFLMRSRGIGAEKPGGKCSSTFDQRMTDFIASSGGAKTAFGLGKTGGGHALVRR
jgi:hypothetical protein